jgi:hypothetical protein
MGGERGRGLETEAAVGSGDDGRAGGLVRNILGGPTWHGSSVPDSGVPNIVAQAGAVMARRRGGI